MQIRQATINDFEALYQLGLNTPEFQVSADEPFMDRDDLELRITSSEDVFLLAEDNKKIIGFTLFGLKDNDRPVKNRYACLTYLVVVPEYRNQGIAKQLYTNALEILKEKGITHIYSWANAESDDSMINFLKKNGFLQGHKYVWMDKKI